LFLLLALTASCAEAAADAESPTAKVREKFKLLDKDHSGGLSKSELEHGKSRLAARFEDLDLDENGELSPAEIREAREKRRQQGE
ncbi:MAG: hypothetical protein ACREV0_10455, partial [Burkholderiales bacterium]